MLIKNSTLGKPKRKRIYTCTLKSENKENHSRDTKMPGDTKKCFSCLSETWPRTSWKWWKFQQKEPPRAAGPLPTHAPRRRKAVPCWLLPSLSALPDTRGCQPSAGPLAESTLMWAGARGAAAELVGDVDSSWVTLGPTSAPSPVEQWDPLPCCPWGILPLSAFPGT